MPSLRSYELPDNYTVLVEVSDNQPLGGMAVSIDDVIRKTGETLAHGLAAVPLILYDIKSTILDKLTTASEVSVEFGIKLGGEAGVIVSKSQAEANFKIAVTWKSPQS